MKRIGYDHLSFDKDVVIDETDSEIIIRDVVIAREIVQPYDIDGEKKFAYKPGDELKDAAWTAEGMRITMDQHPITVVIDRVDLIHGRMANLRFVKNLKDAKTKRPMARGIIADLHFFKKQISAQKQDDIKNMKHRDVSIGFFYDADETPGKWNGDEYDFVQTNICIDHLAGPIPAGRCPMPFCGIGADSIPQKIVGLDPEETETSFRIPTGEDCEVTATITISEDQGITALYCGEEKKIRTYIFSKEKDWTMEKAKEWVEEHKGDEIMKDVLLACFNKADSIRVKVEKYIDILDAASGDMSLEEIDAKIEELRNQRKTIRKKIDELYAPSEENKEIDELYNKLFDVEAELEAYMVAKVNKIAGNAEGDKPGSDPGGDQGAGEPKNDKERFMNHYDLTEEQVDKLLDIMGKEIYKLLPERGQKQEQDEICETCVNWEKCADCEENVGTCSVNDEDYPADHKCELGEWKQRGGDDEEGAGEEGDPEVKDKTESKTPVEKTETLLNNPDLYD